MAGKTIAVVGCGAMGSIYAALLSDAGNEIIAVDPWEAHVAAITANGLHVEGASGARTVRLRAYTKAPNESADLIIVAAKASQVPAMAAAAVPLLGAQTTVLTIQNGLGSADVVAEHLGADRLAVGIAAAFGASLKGPGHAHHNGMEMIRMGAYANLPSSQVEAIAAIWREAGFKAESASNIIAMQWEKLICNVAYSGPSALTGMTVGEIMDDADIGPLSRAAATEAWRTAKALGIAIDVPDAVAHVRAFGARVPKAKPSVLLDHEIGRPSEIDVINGASPREAARAGLEAPVNEAITALVKQKERAFSQR